MDELSRKVFHKEESELTEYERMMLDIMAAKQEAEHAAAEAGAEEAPVEDAAEETAEAPEETEAAETAEEAAAEEAPAAEAQAEEVAAEEAPVTETPAEAPAAEEPAEEAALRADNTDDSDVKIAGEEPIQPKSERIPLLTEEKNPELEPVVVSRPTIQFKNSIER